jgi:hypothetical protein
MINVVTLGPKLLKKFARQYSATNAWALLR